MAPILGIWASSRPTVAPDLGSMFPLGVFTLPSAQTVVTFENIPQNYTHLQFRILLRSSVADWARIKFNNNSTSSDYRWHYIFGTGSSAGAGQGTGETIGVITALGNNNNPAAAVVDILDYKSTVKHKTVRSLNGYDGNGNGQMNLMSNLWCPSTISAINRIDFQLGSSGQFQSGTSFAMYGVL